MTTTRQINKERRALGNLKTAINNVRQTENAISNVGAVVGGTNSRARRRRQRRRGLRLARNIPGGASVGGSWINVPDTAYTQATSRPSIPITPARRLARRGPYVSPSDLILENGVESMLQTLFSGVSGISRGLTNGIEPTAVARLKGAIEIAATGGNTISCAWVPTQLTSTNWFVSSVGAGVQSPYSVTSTSFAGPFNSTNPSLAWRVVRASMKIIPETQLLNQGGITTAAYVPVLYKNGAPTSTNLQFGYTIANLLNASFMKEFKGTETVMLQWVPTTDEVTVSPDTWYTSTGISTSGFAITFSTPNTAVNFRCEYDIGIEYIPNDLYRPFVDRRMPDVSTASVEVVNKFVGNEWDKCMVATQQQYDAMVTLLDPFEHHLTTSYRLASSVGIPAVGLPSAQPGYLSQAFDKVSEVCADMEIMSGYDVCGAVSGTAGKVTRALLNQGGGMNYRAVMG